MPYWNRKNWLEESKACDKERLISWACPTSSAANSVEFMERSSRGAHVEFKGSTRGVQGEHTWSSRVAHVEFKVSTRGLFEGESNENLKYFFIFYGVLIRDSYPDVLLCHSPLHSDLPSRCLQLLQCPLVSLQGVPDWVEESVTELMAFMNFPVHRYTCCTDRHTSPH